MRCPRVLAALLMAFGCLSAGAPAADRLPSPAQLLPADTVIALEVAKPKAVLDRLFDAKTVAAVTSLPGYQTLSQQPQFVQLMGVTAFLELRLGVDRTKALRELLGGGVTFAVTHDGASLLIVDSQNPKLLADLNETFISLAKADAEKKQRPNSIATQDYQGKTVWTIGNQEAHALVGGRLIVSNRLPALKALLDRCAKPAAESLATSSTYQAAHKAVGDDPTAWAYLDVATLKRLPGLREKLKQPTEPLVALLVADLFDAAREANWLAAGLRIGDDGLTLTATSDGKPTGAAAAVPFARPAQSGDGLWPNLPVPRQIAAGSFYRDLHRFYAAKDQLFPERTSGLIFFENMMGIFFSGRDLTEEVLSEPQPQIRFVVAAQAYDPAIGTPVTQVPAFALVLRIRHPKQFGEVVEEAWQKAFGLINFTRGQKAEPGLILDRGDYAGQRYTFSQFSSVNEKDRKALDTRFNFRPALARVGEYFILSSTDGLAKDLIDAVQREQAAPPKPAADVHSLVEVDGQQIAAALAANRQQMIRQNMIEKGSTESQATATVDMILAAVKLLGRGALQAGQGDGRPEVQLKLLWK